MHQNISIWLVGCKGYLCPVIANVKPLLRLFLLAMMSSLGWILRGHRTFANQKSLIPNAEKGLFKKRLQPWGNLDRLGSLEFGRSHPSFTCSKGELLLKNLGTKYNKNS